jgi:transcriptional regulator with XRE-family HTH domain
VDIVGRAEQLEQLKLSIGRTAAAARTSRGWSQAEVGRKLDVDSETISRIERGQNVRLERMLDLATLYQVPISSFFKDAPGPKMQIADELTLTLGVLSDQDKSWVLEMLKAYLNRPDSISQGASSP